MVKLTEQIVYIRTKCTPEAAKKLNLWGCEIDDIELCERMSNMEVLSLSVNEISTLAPLRNCRKLKELYVRKNKICSLQELDHIKDLPDLHTLWIDENPCTMANDYRYKIVKMLPKLTKLDDKPVTLHDHRPPETPADIEIGRDQDYYGSTMTLVNNSYGRGGAIVDTIMQPGFVQYGGGTSSDTSEEECSRPHQSHLNLHQNPMAQSMHPAMVQSVMGGSSPMMSQSMTQSMMQLMNQSMYQPREEQNETDDWGDFSLDDDVGPSSNRPLSMDGIAPRMAMSYYDSGSRTMRPSTSNHFVAGRSVSAPRRRHRQRGESTSPAREHRVQKIMSAVSVLLDELDAQGLRQVVEEAQRRMKKQR
ncbi:hypothetical protein PFISCL1PPCAC_10937 [Pristionchus fissidentatus]|uniref:U2A'/phosphoprotein 32 family A C-terminal domain-containing protein n=1 Tax=Pristionchus fissidentatus TaxID=1538716 RepID=A0AAV5VIY8_9BILA|nr:hypothetical protein PFISCL1PPCAC_10937 [Pristionchus fissidentatus]